MKEPNEPKNSDPVKDPAIVIQQLRKTVGPSFSLGPVSLEGPPGTVCALLLAGIRSPARLETRPSMLPS
jgi:hypothetical protein